MGLLVKELSYSINNQCVIPKMELSLSDGETCLILGASGSGKTTLLSLLTGLEQPDEGSISYDDTVFSDLSESAKDHFRGQNIGILFQRLHLINSLTVYQNIMLAGLLSGEPIEASYVDSILERLNLYNKKDQKAATLSVGEAQRVSLIRAIAGKPKWLFCDEPTSALDDAHTQSMLSLIQQEADTIGTTLIIVTHDLRVKHHMNVAQSITLGG